MAAGRVALDALMGMLPKAAKTVDLGDVTRPATAARVKAIESMVKLPKLSPEDALSAKRGYVARPGDWDVSKVENDLIEATEYNRMDWEREQIESLFEEDFKRGMDDRAKELGFPSARDLEYEEPELWEAASEEVSEWARQREDRHWDLIEDTFSNLPETQRAYKRGLEVKAKLRELPEDHPFRTSLESRGVDINYEDIDESELEGLAEMMGDLGALQSIGVDRDYISRAYGALSQAGRYDVPMLGAAVFGAVDNVPKGLKDKFVQSAPAMKAYMDRVGGERNLGLGLHPVSQSLSYLLKNLNVEQGDTFLSMLPEWEGSLDDLADLARMI